MEADREFTTADLAQAGAAQGQDDGTGRDRAGAVDATTAPLFAPEETDRFRGEWKQVQGEFVDRPRDAVEQADSLVADLMQRLASQFSETRADLERRWDGQEDVSTEDLRVALTQYRSFFERLLEA
ncbi:MAG: hypothetical protein ACRDM1_02875 [Gaiellaceae bacterium]